MCYFDLVRLYAKPYIQNAGANPGVPLRIKAEKSAGGNDLARSTVAEVYTQVLADLNAAEPLAISSFDDDVLNTTRIHKNTIIALKTRVNLLWAIGQALLQKLRKLFRQALLLYHHQVWQML